MAARESRTAAGNWRQLLLGALALALSMAIALALIPPDEPVAAPVPATIGR